MEIGIIEYIASFTNLDKMDVKTGWAVNAGKLISPANTAQYLQFSYVSGLWKWERKIIVNKKSFKIQIFGTAGNFNSEFYINENNKLCSFFSFDSSVLQSFDTLIYNNGDLLEFTLNKDGWGLMFSVKNLSTNQTVLLNASNVAIAIHKLRLITSEVTEISSYKLESSQQKGGTWVIGDSITYGSAATTPLLSWVGLIGWNRLCGAGDRSADAVLLMEEILNYAKPDRVIFAMGTNDSNIEVWKANVQTFKNQMKANKITYIPVCPYANSIRSMQPYYDYIVTNFSVYFDFYTVTKADNSTNFNPAYDSGDNLHPNTLGHNVIGNTVLNSEFYNYFQDFNSFLIRIYYQVFGC